MSTALKHILRIGDTNANLAAGATKLKNNQIGITTDTKKFVYMDSAGAYHIVRNVDDALGTQYTHAMFGATGLSDSIASQNSGATLLTLTPTASNDLTVNHATGAYDAIYQAAGSEVFRLQGASPSLMMAGDNILKFGSASEFIKRNAAGFLDYGATTQHTWYVGNYSCCTDIGMRLMVSGLNIKTISAYGSPATVFLTHVAGLIESRTAAQVLSDIGAAPASHSILSTTHGDTLAASILDGDILIGNVTPKLSKLAISIPAANVRNVLGVDNGELRPSWKTALDATNPTTIGISDAAAPGTSLVFAHRDHQHASPATWAATAHPVLSSTYHSDVLTGSITRGDILYGNATPKIARLAKGAAGAFLTGDGTDTAWSGFYLAGTAGQTYTFPTASCSVVGGSGMQYYVPLWGSGGATLGNSLIQQVTVGSHTGIQISQTAGAGVDPTITNPKNVANMAQFNFYPASGTNTCMALQIVPRGTGLSGNVVQSTLFNTDFTADASNYEFMVTRAAGTYFLLSSGKVGSGTLRPIVFSSGYAQDLSTNPNQLFLGINGYVNVMGGSPVAPFQVGTLLAGETVGNTPVAHIIGASQSLSSQTMVRLWRPFSAGAWYGSAVDFNVYAYGAAAAPWNPKTQFDICLKNTASSTQTANIAVLTLKDDGTITIPALSAAGVLHNSAAGLISTSAIVNGDFGALGTQYTIPMYGATGLSASIVTQASDASSVTLTNGILKLSNTSDQIIRSNSSANDLIFQTNNTVPVETFRIVGATQSLRIAGTKHLSFTDANAYIYAPSTKNINYYANQIHTFQVDNGGIINVATIDATGLSLFYPLFIKSGAFNTTLQTGVQAATITYTLPITAPAGNGYALTSTTGGVWSWGSSMVIPSPNTLTIAALATVNTGVLYAAPTTGLIGATNVAAGTISMGSTTTGLAASVFSQVGSHTIGLDVAAKTWNSTFSALQFGGLGVLFAHTAATAGNGVLLTANAYIKADGNWANIIDDVVTIYQVQGGIHYWYSKASPGGADTTFTLTGAELARLTTTGLGIGGTPTSKLQVFGPLALGNISYLPTDYWSGASPYAMTAADSTLFFTDNHAHTQIITLQAASSYVGRMLFLAAYVAGGTYLSSGANNVVLLSGGAAQAVILSAANGKSWAILQSNGTNWQIIATG
jgi:hypothetical protein